ncbi:MAG TPA: Hpt domain-containing protein [Gemmatimonadaceae bacterium]|jgi:chemotaxis protein histidine kinase CheA|nr:Hpt domain-containing protein [Gemmatimonadaceae bacterium]
MTAPAGFIDFFVLEASEYVEQLDALILQGGATGPDLEALQRTARALRGSATMAKLSAFAEIASGIERIGHALRSGSARWDPALSGALVAAVDDCKLLLRNVRAWGAGDDARSRARIDELARYAPARQATPKSSPAVAADGGYLMTEVANIGAGAELLATRPSDRDAATNVLRRVRALRGIAGVKDHPSLADVLEATEHAAHPLERGEPQLSRERVAVLAAAATLLRAIAAAMRVRTAIDPASPELARFAATLDDMQERETEAERVVPIAELFYQDDGPTVVQTAPNPPTSPAERFRLEVVSQGEHLRRLVSDARSARDDLARERVRRALRQALRGLRQAAESFGETDVAEFVASHNDDVVQLDARALDSLDQVAAMLAQPGDAPGSLASRLRALRRDAEPSATESVVAPAEAPSAPEAAEAPVAVPPVPDPAAAPAAHPTPAGSPSVMTPVSAPAVAPPSAIPQERDRPAAIAMAAVAVGAPSAPQELGSLLDAGIRKLGTLQTERLSAPVEIPEQPPVPIDVLLYRGRAAIERCIEIREQVRGAGGPVDADTLGELFDLLDLALTD